MFDSNQRSRDRLASRRSRRGASLASYMFAAAFVGLVAATSVNSYGDGLGGLFARVGGQVNAVGGALDGNAGPRFAGSLPSLVGVLEDESVSFTLDGFSDPEGDPFAYRLVDEGSGIRGDFGLTDLGEGRVRVDGAPSFGGTFALTLMAVDALGRQAAAGPIALEVIANRAPVYSGSLPPAGDWILDQEVELVFDAFSDPDDDPLSFQHGDLGAGLVRTPDDGRVTLSGTPGVGSYQVAVTASDPDGLSTSAGPVDLTVRHPVSCQERLQAVPGSSDGVYTIDPDGAGGVAPFDVYCDMTTAGGGWIKLRMATSVSDTNTFWWSKWPPSDSLQCRGVNTAIWGHLSACPEGAFDAYHLDEDVRTHNQAIRYHRFGAPSQLYSMGQIAALHGLITEIHEDTQLVTHTTDDDGCDPNGEIYLQLEIDGPQFHATPYTSVTTEQRHRVFVTADLPTPAYLLPRYIDFGDYDVADCSGGPDSASFGYEDDFILVR